MYESIDQNRDIKGPGVWSFASAVTLNTVKLESFVAVAFRSLCRSGSQTFFVATPLEKFAGIATRQQYEFIKVLFIDETMKRNRHDLQYWYV